MLDNTGEREDKQLSTIPGEGERGGGGRRGRGNTNNVRQCKGRGKTNNVRQYRGREKDKHC